jgi:hypothetical protein
LLYFCCITHSYFQKIPLTQIHFPLKCLLACNISALHTYLKDMLIVFVLLIKLLDKYCTRRIEDEPQFWHPGYQEGKDFNCILIKVRNSIGIVPILHSTQYCIAHKILNLMFYTYIVKEIIPLWKHQSMKHVLYHKRKDGLFKISDQHILCVVSVVQLASCLSFFSHWYFRDIVL